MPASAAPRADLKEWKGMNEIERLAVIDLGFNKITWRTDSCIPSLGVFDPEKTNVDVPELKQFDLKYFEKLDLPASATDGNITSKTYFLAFSKESAAFSHCIAHTAF